MKRALLVFWGFVLSVGPLTQVAILLHRHTHHRPLGAVTFAFAATAILLGCVLVAWRCQQRAGRYWRLCRGVAISSVLWAFWQLV